ncbi:GNAT family N-acetyltransferase [Profundibacterium mesophilum]|uniref:Gcn5-related N-acetyltransferase family protein n=1 Tax=Profundibacterium mesophilum KAUST100406-0324 TaxID=1037889 RepID=A0A921TEN9_9RHOB|nr:GNAT family N-acetyltransferase [Profundibacterium mesophilum]KAF0675644.1 Gcn5-related N-acetyltransferase family protein [Profundibacterium mesophilum KAUST100406-0324]
MSVDIRILKGDDVEPQLDALARLRIKVFHDFPYYYDGDYAYERAYCETYRDNERAILVGAFDGQTLIGAATGTPLEDHEPQYVQPYAEAGYEVDQIFYCAESVLLPEYRGHGLGHAFFDQREKHAVALGRRYATFCSVMRPDDHPARPEDYQPLDGFWEKRGYARMDDMTTYYHWRDRGEDQETIKQMQIWMREL